MQETTLAKRPTDPNQLARKIIGIATGEEPDDDINQRRTRRLFRLAGAAVSRVARLGA